MGRVPSKELDALGDEPERSRRLREDEMGSPAAQPEAVAAAASSAPLAGGGVDRPRSTPARNVSPWTRKAKARRLMWSIVHRCVFRFTLHNAYRFRAALLRAFGANLGRNVRFRRTVRVEIPWNLEIADDVSVGDAVILYSLGTIRIGARTFISQYAHLCAGTHDFTRNDYPLLRPPVVVGEDCWIATDAFVGPGVTVGDRSVLGARASAFSDIPCDVVAVGNPAKPVRARVLQRIGAEAAPAPYAGPQA
jgi:putative colanic acid biosynthesis acetyltransferase WcaF